MLYKIGDTDLGHIRTPKKHSPLCKCAVVKCPQASSACVRWKHGGVAALQTDRSNLTEHCWREEAARIKGKETRRKERKGKAENKRGEKKGKERKWGKKGRSRKCSFFSVCGQSSHKRCCWKKQNSVEAIKQLRVVYEKTKRTATQNIEVYGNRRWHNAGFK